MVQTQWALVEMQAKLVEKVEQPLEGLIGNVDLGVSLFELMHLEEAAVQVRNLAEQLFQLAVQLAIFFGGAQGVVEQTQQEIAVEGVKLVLPF